MAFGSNDLASESSALWAVGVGVVDAEDEWGVVDMANEAHSKRDKGYGGSSLAIRIAVSARRLGAKVSSRACVASATRL